MNSLMLEDIQDSFADVIVKLSPGEVVQIISGDKVIARLTGMQEPFKTKPLRTKRQPGSAIGTLKIISDDDEYLKDFSEYM